MNARKRNTRSRVLSLVVLLGAALYSSACAPADKAASRFELPTFNSGDGSGECPAADMLEPAVWALAADSLVIGTVTRVSAAPMPFQLGSLRTTDDPPPEHHEPDTCNGTLLPALEVTLGDLNVIAGDQVRDSLVLTFGTHILGRVWDLDWGRTMRAESDGSVTWLEDDGGRIVVGQRIGIDLLCDPDWNLCGNAARPLFRLDENDRVRFQRSSGCPALVPDGVEGIHVDELPAMVENSRSNTPALENQIEERRSIMTRQRYTRFYYFFEGGCHPGEPACALPGGECGSGYECTPQGCVAAGADGDDI